MYVPYCVIQDLIIHSGLRQPPTPSILIISFPRIVIQVGFHLKGSLGGGKIFCTCMSLEWSVGWKFLLVLGNPSLIHRVLSAISLGMLLGEGTTKFRMLCLTGYLYCRMLFLKKVSVTIIFTLLFTFTFFDTLFAASCANYLYSSLIHCLLLHAQTIFTLLWFITHCLNVALCYSFFVSYSFMLHFY